MSLIKNLFLGGCIVLAQIVPSRTHAANVLRFGPTQAFAYPTYVSTITVDRKGNNYMLGSFEGAVDFGTTNLVGQGGGDIFVAKLGPSGSVSRAMALGSTNNDLARAFVVMPREIFSLRPLLILKIPLRNASPFQSMTHLAL